MCSKEYNHINKKTFINFCLQTGRSTALNKIPDFNPTGFVGWIHRKYNLIGALSTEEIAELSKITSVKFIEQVVYRFINKLKIGFELPRQFYVEKCDEKGIPLSKKWKFHKPAKNFDFSIPEYEECTFNGGNVLEVSNSSSKYIIPIQNIEVLNWFTLQYERITKIEFDEILTFFGFKLFKIRSEKKHNNRVIEHYFLFAINDQGVKYVYFSYPNRHLALRKYLKKVRNFDFTLSLLRSPSHLKNKIYDHISKSESNHKPTFENPDINGNAIKQIINRLDIFDIGGINGRFFSIVKNHFIFDDDKKVFAINSLISLPTELEKYLISLSGHLPIFKRFNLELPNDKIDELAKGAYFTSKEVDFKLYYEVPEEIAFAISNSLIDPTVYQVPGQTAKPYSTYSISL
jgi:hypothetical protein